jgi:Xaa-Pro aminopeptidase
MSKNQDVDKLRLLFSQKNIAAYIIPSSDPHQSEYVAEYWKSRYWLSKFYGSAGTAVVTMDGAYVWTDSRYFLQAEKELASSGFTLQKLENQGANEYIDWLATTLPSRSIVALDGSLFSINQVLDFKKILDSKGIELNTDVDFMPSIWKNRPPLPVNPIFEHDLKYTGLSRSEKISKVREELSRIGCENILLTALDDIAWLFNIRSNDVESNPVTIAYAIVSKEKSTIFIDSKKVNSTIKDALGKDNILLAPYEDIADALIKINSTIAIDFNQVNYVLYSNLKKENIKSHTSIPSLLKAKKSPIEIANIRNAMTKDGVALTQFFMWLENILDTGGTPTEYEVANKIAEFRSKQDGYFGESFNAIIGYNGNGAIIHYKPAVKSAKIKKSGMLLLDSGGQYLDGTTDITRTIALGRPNAEQKLAYTCVLKGHIALALQKFPSGTKGVQLDILARQFLWNNLLNYAHGTGHGVGFFLNVHEPHQGIVPGVNTRGTTVHEEGMLTSNEPGFYLTNKFGIRIENLIVVAPFKKTAFGDFSEFETITYFPIDTILIDKKLMTKEEKSWLNNYHSVVYDKLSPRLSANEKKWLENKCKSI